MEVHHRVLEKGFRKRPGHSADKFNFTPCTTARPDSTFVPGHAPTKLVNFCIYAYKKDDDDWASANRALARLTPTHSVNHTDFSLLQLRRIMLRLRDQARKLKGQSSNWRMAYCALEFSCCSSASFSQSGPISRIAADYIVLADLDVQGHNRNC